jgi:hypothetical protein
MHNNSLSLCLFLFLFYNLVLKQCSPFLYTCIPSILLLDYGQFVTILPLGHMASRTRVTFYFHFLHVSPSVSSFVSYVVSPPFCIHKSVSFNDVFLPPLPSVTCMILIHVSLIFITELEYINTSRTTFIPQSTLCKRLLVIQSIFLCFLVGINWTQ